MANYLELKDSINESIKGNGKQEITGWKLNAVLNTMVNVLGENLQYKGVALLETKPGTPDQNIFYIAGKPGTYVNFNNIEVKWNETAILVWKNNKWTKNVLGLAPGYLMNKSISFEKGKYIDTKGKLVSYEHSKISEILFLPKKDCVIYGAWNGSTAGYGFVFLDENFGYINGVNPTGYEYKWVAGGSHIPSNAVYFVIQCNVDGLIVAGEEQLTTSIPYRNRKEVSEMINKITNDLNSLTSQVQENTQNIKNKADYTFIVGKNLFDKNQIINGKYISSYAGTLITNEKTAVSPLIPIEAGKKYYLYRDISLPANEIRFVKEDKTTHLKALNPDGSERDNYQFSKSGTIMAPQEAKYFQFTCKWDNKECGYDKTQVEEGDEFTGYEPYKGRNVVPYEHLPYELEGLPKRVDNLEKNQKAETITIANSGKIGFFSNSFLNGYCMKGKHALDNLSMWSDYLFYNFGHSGDDALECLGKINKNETWLGDVPVQQWGLTYGVIAMQDNDGALYAANPNTYYENFKKIAEAIKAMGGIPIIGTEHDNSSYYYALSRLSEEMGYMFMNWGKIATALFNTVFPPFWNNSHPATRTHWLWTYGMKQYLDTLPRPRKAIKLFRVRPGVDASNLQNLVYTDLVSRSKRFAEIENGASVLTSDTEKYFDRLNQGGKYETVKNEYQKLQAKAGSVSFSDYALIECVTPYDRNNISYLDITLNATGVTEAYIKRNLSLKNPLPGKRYIAFGVTDGKEFLKPGTRFEITGGVFSETLKGEYVVEDVVNNIVVTTTLSTGKTTSGTDNPTTNVIGVTLKGSYDYPTADYMKRYTEPLGEWDKITLIYNGKTDLTQFLSYAMDFDKVSILLKGSNIQLSEVYFSCSGYNEKENLTKKFIQRKYGKSLLTDSLLDDGTAWDSIDSVAKYTPVANPSGGGKEALPKGITTVRELNKGEKISQTIKTSELNKNQYRYDNIQIRIIARYFPLYVDSDEKYNQSEIKPGSYDCANMSVKIGDAANCLSAEVGAYWNEFVFNTTYSIGDKIHIECTDKKIQIAKVEVDLIE